MHLLTIILLGVFEKVDESVQLDLSDARIRHYCVGVYFAQVTVFVVPGRSPGPVSAKQFVV